MEEFFNSLTEIGQRTKSRRSEKQSKCRPEQWQNAGQNSGRWTAQSTGVHKVHRRSLVNRPIDHSKENGQPTSMPNFLLGSVDRPVGQKDKSVDRPVGRQANLLLLLGFEFHFWKGVEFNFGFLKPWDSLAINKGVEPSWIVCKEKHVLDCWINKISLSLAPRTLANCRTSLNIVFVFSLIICSCLLDISLLHLSQLIGVPHWLLSRRAQQVVSEHPRFFVGSCVDSKSISCCLAEIVCQSRSSVGTIFGIMCQF